MTNAPRRARLDEIFALRHAILRTGRPVETARFEGDDEPETRHYGLFEGDRCVACATVMRRPREDAAAWQLRGIAVAADRQRRGLGSRLLAFLEADLRGDAPASPRLWCNARVGAVAFYRKHGWTVESDAFDVPDVGPHHRMAKQG
jgi:GNAT superfamily N-acetyltransferase